MPFTGSFTFNDPGSGDGPWTALVDFGDGSPQLFFTSTPQAPPVGAINVVDANMGTNGSTISIPSHSYAVNHTITVMVTDSVGAASLTGSATQDVLVVPTQCLDNVGFEGATLDPWRVLPGGVGSEVTSLGPIVPPAGGVSPG